MDRALSNAEERKLKKRLLRYLLGHQKPEEGILVREIANADAFSDVGAKRVASCLVDLEKEGEIEVRTKKGKCYYYRDPSWTDVRTIDDLQRERGGFADIRGLLAAGFTFAEGKRFEGANYTFEIPDVFEYQKDDHGFTAWLPKNENERDVKDSPLVLSLGKMEPLGYDGIGDVHSIEWLGFDLYAFSANKAMEKAKQKVLDTSWMNRDTLTEDDFPQVFPIDTGDWIFSCMVQGLNSYEQHYDIFVYSGEGQVQQFLLDLRTPDDMDESLVRSFLSSIMSFFHYRKDPIALRESLTDQEFTCKPLTKETAKKWLDLLKDDMESLVSSFHSYCENAARLTGALHTTERTFADILQTDMECMAGRLEVLFGETAKFARAAAAVDCKNRYLPLCWEKVSHLLAYHRRQSVTINGTKVIFCWVRNVEEVRTIWEDALGVTSGTEVPLTQEERLKFWVDASVRIQDRLQEFEQDLPSLNAAWETEIRSIWDARENEANTQYEEECAEQIPDDEIHARMESLENAIRESRAELCHLDDTAYFARRRLERQIEDAQKELESCRGKTKRKDAAWKQKRLQELEDALKWKYRYPAEPAEVIRRIRTFVSSAEQQEAQQGEEWQESAEKVLSCVEKSGSMTCSEIAAELDKTEIDTARILERMQDLDLLESCQVRKKVFYCLPGKSKVKKTALKDAKVPTAFAKDRAVVYDTLLHHSLCLNQKNRYPKLEKLSVFRILQVMLSLSDEGKAKLILDGDDIKCRHL